MSKLKRFSIYFVQNIFIGASSLFHLVLPNININMITLKIHSYRTYFKNRLIHQSKNYAFFEKINWLFCHYYCIMADSIVDYNERRPIEKKRKFIFHFIIMVITLNMMKWLILIFYNQDSVISILGEVTNIIVDTKYLARPMFITSCLDWYCDIISYRNKSP